MKTNLFSKKMFIVIALLFVFTMNADSQNRIEVFMSQMLKTESAYKEFIKEGKHKEAIAPLTTLINLIDTSTIYKVINIPEASFKQSNNLYYYDLACCYAVIGKKKQAISALERAINLGYTYYDNMLSDNDLVSLRNEKKYNELLKVVKERTPLKRLKGSAPYAKDTKNENVMFTYQSKDDYRLHAVRDYLKLDSVAGQGDELSKIINLLHFVHDNMPHDGSHRAFAEMDAIDLYNYCKVSGRGVNCRQLAISLCEMYLSIGIPARYVTCLPADPNDTECHVINSVWSEQLQKWIWIDPTNDAWVMDENGNLLSIAEVRERMINEQPLVLCETANWNHRERQTKEGYLYNYMAKNLYYFECNKHNQFNPESDYRENTAEYIYLVPVGFAYNKKGVVTTDSDLFWAKPETIE